MNIGIQNYTIMSEEIPANKPFTLRFTDAQNIRFWRLMLELNKRGYVNKSNLLRELLGLSDLKVLTKEDVKYFQTGEKAPTNSETNNAVIIGTPVFPELVEVKPKKKRAG